MIIKISELQIGDKIYIRFGNGYVRGKIVGLLKDFALVKTLYGIMEISDNGYRPWAFLNRPKTFNQIIQSWLKK